MKKIMRPDRFDHLLLYAQIRQESAFNSKAVSIAGAMGLMQIMPPTWKEISKIVGLSDPFDPLQNILAGLFEMNRQVKNFKKLDLALTAYNWGSGNLRRLIIDAGSNDLEVLKKHQPEMANVKPMPREAREYAQRIFNHYADPETLDMADDFLKIIN